MFRASHRSERGHGRRTPGSKLQAVRRAVGHHPGMLVTLRNHIMSFHFPMPWNRPVSAMLRDRCRLCTHGRRGRWHSVIGSMHFAPGPFQYSLPNTNPLREQIIFRSRAPMPAVQTAESCRCPAGGFYTSAHRASGLAPRWAGPRVRTPSAATSRDRPAQGFRRQNPYPSLLARQMPRDPAKELFAPRQAFSPV